MKKIYAILFAGIVLVLTNTASAQFIATTSGNWSSNATWAPGVKPGAVCNGCSITINAGIVVTLDVSTKFTGGTVLTIGSDASSASALVIPASGGSSIATGFNILLDAANANNKIVLLNAFSALAAIPGGTYDGIFSDVANGTVDIKTVGNLSSPSIFFLGQPTGAPNPPPINGSSLAGPITLSSSGALPIVLDHFTASLDGKQIILEWATLVEINSDHFGVERSSDGAHWETLSDVSAAGNSETKQSYSYADRNPGNTANYYRLKMVDRDGKYKYSPVRVVRGSLIQGYSIFPNPARDYVNITISKDAPAELTLRLTNAFGQTLQEKKLTRTAGTTVSIPVHAYPTGNYILTLSGQDGTKSVTKILIAH